MNSIRGLTKRDGTWSGRWRYRIYGSVLAESTVTGAPAVRYRWIGREFDEESGLYFMRARYYDPSSQRFTQEDPSGFGGSGNLYVYGDGNPTNGRDWSGLTMDYSAYGPEVDHEDQVNVFEDMDNTGVFGSGMADRMRNFFDDAAELVWQQNRNQAAARATATAGRNNTVVITNPDGTIDTRSGGSRAWRNNNPGNLDEGQFSNSHGAIGSAGGFAVFPDETTGANALTALLQTATYQGLTVSGVIARYSPPSENNTANYQRFVQRQTGIVGTRAMSSLTAGELANVQSAIRTMEGWVVGTVTTRSSSPARR